jgi:hypothetical protein
VSAAAAGRSRRHRRRVAAAGLLAALVATTGSAFGPEAGADPSPGGSVALPLSVDLGRVRPYAPQPGGTLRLTGALRNTTPTAIDGVSVQLLLSRSKIGSRGEFDDYAGTPDGEPPADAVAVSTAQVRLPRTQIAGGGSERFAVTVPVDDLQPLEAWQVYELAVAVTGLPADSVTGFPVTVGRLRTFLPYAPVDATGVGVPTRVAWLWPLVDRPHRLDDTTWVDDGLAPQLETDGRLGALVAAARAAADQQRPPPRQHSRRWERRHRDDPPKPPKPPLQPVPVTWVVDPMLLDDATAMTGGYRVGRDGDATDGTGADTAFAWLAQLRAAAGGGVVLPLPYGDPDVTAAVRSLLSGELQVAAASDGSLVDDLGPATRLSYAWPAGGFIDQRALTALVASGTSTVVLDSTALPYADGTPNETPSARTTLSANLDALLVDDGLDAIVDSGATYPTAGPLAVQRLLSELLMIQAEQPFDERWFVLAPDRRWSPAPEFAATILSATGQVPWIAPVTLDEVAASPPYEKVQRKALDFPQSARQALLPRSYLDAVRDLKEQVDAFRSILPPGAAQARSLDIALLRLLSSAWQTNPTGADQRLAALDKTVSDAMAKVHIATEDNSLVTLTSDTGNVPVTVTNDLDTAVTVVVTVDDSLQFDVEHSRVSRTIPPHRSVPVDIRATAKVSGQFPLFVSLYTPADRGRQYGDTVRINVRATAYGRAALAITAGATAALLVAVVVRLVRRARRHRRGEPVDA